MIKIIKELKIEVSKPNIFQAVVAKQYDMNTRFIKATLVDGSDVIYIPNDPDRSVKVVINANRPDGLSKGFDGYVNDDGTVTVPLHSWMLEMEGTVICDISVIDTEADDNKKLTTTSFTLLVEKAAYGGGDVTNDPQYDVIVSLLETCQEASVVAQEALDKSSEANAKYDACVEATANANAAADNANAVREEVEAGGFIESLKELNKGNKFSTWVGTQEEYDAIENKDPNCLYIIKDAEVPADYIIEQDLVEVSQTLSNGENALVTWHYCKWKSGICELFGHTMRNVDFSSLADGEIGRSNIMSVKLPFIVKGQNAKFDCDDINVWASASPNSDYNYTSLVLWRKSGYSAIYYDITIHLKGVWNEV